MKKLYVLTLAALAIISLCPGQGSAALQGPAGSAAPMVEGGSVAIDLNTAGIDELVTVKGVGPALAQKIVELRTRIGGFSSIDDLLEIRGIGPKNLKALRPRFTLTSPPSPVAKSPSNTPLP